MTGKITKEELHASLNTELSQFTTHLDNTTNYIEVGLLMNQSIPTEYYTPLVFNNKIVDYPELFDLLPDGKIKIKKKGRYFVQGQVAFEANVTGFRILNVLLEKADTTSDTIAKSTTLPLTTMLSHRMQISRMIDLDVNDVICLAAYQFIAGGLPLLVANGETYLTVGMV